MITCFLFHHILKAIGDTLAHTLFSYTRFSLCKLIMWSWWLCLVNATRFAHLWTLGVEGVTFKCVFKGSRAERADQQPGEESTEYPTVILTLMTPSFHFPKLQKHRELCYPCLPRDMKRKSCNKNKCGRSDVAVKSCGKRWVENRRTRFPLIRTM